MKQVSPRLLITAFFVIAFSFVGFFVVITYRNVNQTQEQNKRTGNAIRFLLLSKNIANHLENLSSAQRSYIFGSKEESRGAYDTAVNYLLTDTDSLRHIAELNPERATRLNKMNYLIKERIADSRRLIALFDSAGVYSVVEKLKEGVSRKITDSVYSISQSLELEDHAFINQSNQYLESMAQITNYRFLILAFVFLIILLIFSQLIYYNFKKNEKTAAQLRYQASLIDTIPDAIFTTDKHFIIKSWNRQAELLYGVHTKDACGKTLNELMRIHIAEEERVTTLKKLNASGSYNDEYLVTKKDGTQVYVLASVSKIENTEGTTTGYIAVHRDITARKQLEDNQKQFNLELERQVKIKTSETTNILERITDGFLVLDKHLTFTYVNKKAGELLGHTPEEMVGKNIFSDFPQTQSQSFNEACHQSFQTQQYIYLENFYAPLDLWFENDIYPSPDGLSVFFKDVTYKKKTETALKESEERYRHLIENIHAGVVVHKPDGSILLYNQEAARLLNIAANMGKAGSVPHIDWYSVADDGKPKQEEYPAQYVIRTGKPLINTTAGISDPQSPGKMIWVLMSAFPELDDHMQLKQVVLTFVDITNRKRAEEELKKNEDILNMAQKIARIGSWEFYLDTQELRWSKELYRIFELENIPPDQLYDAFRNKFHPDDLPKLDAIMQQALESKKGYTYQHRIITSNGNLKHILGIGEVILDEDGNVTGLKGTGQDITDLVKAEERLQNSYRQIKLLVTHLQEVREQERTNMAREIHDELGQQLTGLKMYISWLNKKVVADDKDIREKFHATMELIEETIKSVRKISMELRPSMLDDLGLMAALEWQSNEFEKRSGISTEFINEVGGNEIPARLKTGLFRIYQESLTNVARHADAKKIVSSLKFENNLLILTITDDGKGFSFRNIEGKKTLGLFGMKERTREMGGSYEITSEPGKGTTVSVTIPVTGVPEQA